LKYAVSCSYINKIIHEIEGKKIYITAIEPATIYGSGSWAFKKQDAKKMIVAEVKILGRMSGQ